MMPVLQELLQRLIINLLETLEGENRNDFSSVDRYFWSTLGCGDKAGKKKKSNSAFLKELVS